MQKILVTGVKPTGTVHVGNYFGAMRQVIDFQNDYRQFVFVANYHALTSVSDRNVLHGMSLDVAMDYLAIGVDPKKTTLFLQSDVPMVTELAWIFNTITTVPYLERAHAFKDAQAKNKEINVGLFDYPILMAADILIYGADIVPVGFDQKQHVEIARDTAQKFNRIFGETFKIPEPFIVEEVKIVPGIDGRKMSKSYDNVIPLFGSDEEIRKAIMGITTDSKGVDEPKDPKTCTIFALHELVSSADVPDIKARYSAGKISYKESKEILFENMRKFIIPMRICREEISQDKNYVLTILREGGNVARAEAEKMMNGVREKTGLANTYLL